MQFTLADGTIIETENYRLLPPKKMRATAPMARRPPPHLPPGRPRLQAAPVPVGSRSVPVIAHLFPWDLAVGGAQRMLFEWCRAEAAAFDIRIFTTSEMPSAWSFGRIPIVQNRDGRQLAAMVAALAPDLCVLHQPGPEWASMVPAGCPAVWIIHGETSFSRAITPEWGRPSAVLTNYAPAALANGWQGIPLTIMPLGVDLERYTPGEERHLQYLCAGIVARCSPEKVPPGFVKALASWQPGQWRIRMIGVGSPNGYQDEVHAALDRFRWVEWSGDIAPDAMPQAYRELDALIVPSVTETGSYAIVEALASGLPIVARKVGGIPYQLNGCGMMHTCDRDLLTLLRSLDDRTRRREMGKASRKEAVDRHDLRKHIAAHSAIYRKAMGAPPVRVEAPRPLPAAAPVTAPAPSTRPPAAGRPVILHVTPWALTLGGGQRFIDEWCRLEGWRWDVHIATGKPDKPCWEFPGATVHHLDAEQPATLEALCRRINPDVVVTHNCDHGFCTGAAAWPQVWYAHGENILQNGPPGWGPPAAFVTYYNQPAHSAWTGLRRHIVRLGVDTERYRPAAPAAERARPVAGIVGRLSVEKMPRNFVAALKAWQPGPWLVRFVGSAPGNPYADWLRSELAGVPWVEFAGDVAPTAMPDAYHGLDAVVVPSSTETGSYAIVEGLASGLPVVSRELPGPRHAGGAAVAFADTDAGILAVLRTWDDAATRREIGARSREYAVANLAVADQMKRLTAVFASVAKPRVSVLMPVYNTPVEWLREAVESVFAQTEPLWELVSVDDGSTDTFTAAELDGYDLQDPRFNDCRKPHGGCAAALNWGLGKCRSELVARMDSDDRMMPERLAKQRAYMLAHPECDVLGSQMSWSNQSGVTSHPATVDIGVLSRLDFALNHPTIMYRRDTIVKAGGYDETLKAVEDFDLWLRLARAGAVIRNMPDVLLHYRVSDGQMSKLNDVRAIIAELREKNGVPKGGPVREPTPEQIFNRIYKGGVWGPPLTSGLGSTMSATENIRKALPELISRRQIGTILDAGCGRSAWMREAVPPSVKGYVGMDASSAIIEVNRAMEPREGWSFVIGDLSAGEAQGRFDLIVCRDVLVHLPYSRVLAALRNAKTMAPLLLATHWPGAANADIPMGEWRKLDMNAPPFCLPPPLETIAEADAGKFLALFDLSAWNPPG